MFPMFAHDLEKEKAYQISRFDRDHLLGNASPHPIELDGETWATVEHYFQAQMVANETVMAKIKQAPSAEDAYKIGTSWFRRKRKDWKQIRRVMMTRALYTKAQMYPDVKAALLKTGDELIIETSAYDHYWGIGRDQRGDNMLGKTWMDVRRKLLENITVNAS